MHAPLIMALRVTVSCVGRAPAPPMPLRAKRVSESAWSESPIY